MLKTESGGPALINFVGNGAVVYCFYLHMLNSIYILNRILWSYCITGFCYIIQTVFSSDTVKFFGFFFLLLKQPCTGCAYTVSVKLFSYLMLSNLVKMFD